MSSRPRRWLDPGSGAPPGVRDLLRAAPEPDAAARDRMWSAIAASTGAAPPTDVPAGDVATAAATEAARATATTALAKTAVAATFGAKKLALLVLLSGTAAHRDAPARVAPPPAAVVAAAERTPSPPPPPPRVRSSRAAAPPRVVGPPPPPVAPPPSARARVVARAAPVAAPVTPEAAPEAPPAVIATAPPVAPPPDPVAEQLLLTQARALLRAAPGAPSRALALTEQHAREFPSGMLGHEREALAVEALAVLGRPGEALARAEAFLRAHPTSTAAPRVRELRAEIVRARTIP